MASRKRKAQKQKTIWGEIWEWIYTIVIALAIAMIIKVFLFDIVVVDGNSMHPTLKHKERLIVTKLGYTPDNGDIIILDSTYKQRDEHYDNLASEKGKEELNTFEKAVNYFTLPKSLKTKFYVKRIIATPGQTIDLKDGKVYIDGELLEEDYYTGTTEPTDSSVSYPITVDENCVFVMGDNRHNSSDSRFSGLGQVPYEAIIGKAQLRIFPFSTFGAVD